MAIIDLFSKRRKRERGEFPDVYEYDCIPKTLRIQIIHLIGEIYSQDNKITNYARSVFHEIEQALSREYGQFSLTGGREEGFESLSEFILNEADPERVLDAVEILFRYADNQIRDNSFYFNRSLSMDDALEELNARFKESGIGYQFESGEIIRIDSEFIHSEAVIPLLVLLRSSTFSTVNQEFLEAHKSYRHGRYESCLVEANKSLETMLKVIAERRGWKFGENDSAKKLIEVCLKNGLIPKFLHNQLNALQSILESGIPTTRNKLAGHGQGSQVRVIPEFMAEYTMHLTATTLLMLGRASGY